MPLQRSGTDWPPSRATNLSSSRWSDTTFFTAAASPETELRASNGYARRRIRAFLPLNLDLGRVYESGVVGSPDYAEAIRWYRRAAEQPTSNWDGLDANNTSASGNDSGFEEKGLVAAQTRLGRLLFYGPGIPRDYAEAAKWFRLAADNGSVFSQCMLAGMYSNGDGVPRDDAEAARLYKEPAERGYPPAQYSLGVLFRFGRGVPQNHEEAVRWFRLAAENGHNEARFELACAFVMGQGAPRSHSDGAR